MKRIFAAALVAVGLAVPASAQDFVPVKDRSAFLDLVNGKELRIGLYGLSLNVLPDGRIAGSAVGRTVTGNWSWENGYFCRDMDWGERDIGYNCQLVEVKGSNEMRFTVDRGEGQSATFRLR
ncbi:dihydrodipicolinate reductase [Ponticoccus sp. SC2-23]|uniref:dihydrodipicolinate reductase n=1 Tax=Alexandriicola marinus TaxID=2081710 RepID=UPI000FDC337C|nr:dihydrodipicolinate reductase [Alexandriicola marinus]MBM1220484.1 dihydrodipicolinate reductase [Ponticoccus sp. SC6-9]MBM1225170.1 dihydrodipicolinate reductase [Ponticoccus sp. SC6-15]MBM1228684.1 dihydrodipicolinate reductase [Ponticoccus sp. SC6-38]MBM1233679.1 dihydrodipicolinate reductase [Ponticoccus sp. SC6-45]MBM1239185.1 dihydrodipicolinate reductase [Ponticoccus sp. SC6-49]MBM1242967.1 dihydrodipicolinate reductase [Ponticoccus sp. SC2-64]MBM1247203.1 dihydrodipicolinate reduc